MVVYPIIHVHTYSLIDGSNSKQPKEECKHHQKSAIHVIDVGQSGNSISLVNKPPHNTIIKDKEGCGHDNSIVGYSQPSDSDRSPKTDNCKVIASDTWIHGDSEGELLHVLVLQRQ